MKFIKRYKINITQNLCGLKNNNNDITNIAHIIRKENI